MLSIKKWLLSIPLAIALSLFNLSNASEIKSQQTSPDQNQIQKEQTFADYTKIYSQEMGKEIGRRRERLNNLEAFNIINQYIYERNYKGDYPLEQLTQYELEVMEDFMEDVSEDALKESVDRIDWINDLENNLKKMFGYEVFFKTNKTKKEAFYSPTLKEEDRLEDREQEEITTFKQSLKKYFGQGYEMHTGVKPYLKSSGPNMKVYARLENLSLFNYEFKRATLEFNTEQEAQFKLQKILDENWYAQFRVKTKELIKGDKISLSFVREIKNPRARIFITLGGRPGDNEFFMVGYSVLF